MKIVQCGGLSYKLTNGGTYYDFRTPDAVVELLETCRKIRLTVILSYGNSETGKQWLEENDIVGRIGRSTGPIKSPLLVKNGSNGGNAILTHCMVRVRDKKTCGVLWSHKDWHLPKFHWRLTEDAEVARRCPLEVVADGVIVARFKDLKSAKKWSTIIGTSLVVPLNYGKTEVGK